MLGYSEISIPQRIVELYSKANYLSPMLCMSREVIEEKYKRFTTLMPRVQPFYAVKANPNIEVLTILMDAGSGFEIASIQELGILFSIGVSPDKILFSNPVKSIEAIISAAAKGINWFVVDTIEEMEKVHTTAPSVNIFLRIQVSNVGSDWPLSSKFGIYDGDVAKIIDYAVEHKCNLRGISFHVGSQCRNPANWSGGIKKTCKLVRTMMRRGIDISMINIGGGFPVQLTEPIPSILEISDIINIAIEHIPNMVEIYAEPGRFMVSDAGCFVCKVTLRTTRNGENWIYLDSGMFGGLMELSQGLQYEIIIPGADGKLVPYNIAGGSCDSIDIVEKQRLLPLNIKSGMLVYIRNAGAYTTAYASEFNGFPLPGVKMI